MIIEYEDRYSEEVTFLLERLQMYIESIDKEEYNIYTPFFGKHYFNKVLLEVCKNDGKILLYKDGDEIVGLIAGIVNNLEEESYGYKFPKRGRIIELVVLEEYRDKGIGTKLMNEMEDYLRSIDCKDILISAMAYNEAIKLYEKLGYHARMVDMIKDIRT